MKKFFAKKSVWMLTLFMLLYICIIGISCMSSPKNIGLVDGKLQPCPDSPNCVSSQSQDEEHKIAPIKYDGEMAAAKDKLKTVINHLPRTEIIKDEDVYLYSQSTTFFFRFVDDSEFLFDDKNKVIHVRSASRVGYSDLGVNRSRIESIRKEFHSEK